MFAWAALHWHIHANAAVTARGAPIVWATIRAVQHPVEELLHGAVASRLILGGAVQREHLVDRNAGVGEDVAARSSIGPWHVVLAVHVVPSTEGEHHVRCV